MKKKPEYAPNDRRYRCPGCGCNPRWEPINRAERAVVKAAMAHWARRMRYMKAPAGPVNVNVAAEIRSIERVDAACDALCAARKGKR